MIWRCRSHVRFCDLRRMIILHSSKRIIQWWGPWAVEWQCLPCHPLYDWHQCMRRQCRSATPHPFLQISVAPVCSVGLPCRSSCCNVHTRSGCAHAECHVHALGVLQHRFRLPSLDVNNDEDTYLKLRAASLSNPSEAFGEFFTLPAWCFTIATALKVLKEVMFAAHHASPPSYVCRPSCFTTSSYMQHTIHEHGETSGQHQSQLTSSSACCTCR